MSSRRFWGNSKLPIFTDATGVWGVRDAYYAALDNNWPGLTPALIDFVVIAGGGGAGRSNGCLLYTSPSPRD